jgi:hypothetical protein
MSYEKVDAGRRFRGTGQSLPPGVVSAVQCSRRYENATPITTTRLTEFS